MLKNEKGQAFVEAAIIFPIMIMIFAALVLLSIYLPTRGALQRATQNAATTIAVVESDTWLFFDASTMSFFRETNKSNLENVYVALFTTMDVQDIGERIVTEIEGRNLSSKAGTLTVNSNVIDRVIYKEVVVEAKREFPIPIDLSFIQFPRTISIIVTSTAVVKNGAEFVRTVDMAVDFVQYITDRFGLTDLSGNISSAGTRVRSLLGW
ncbi:MAG: pilus assembly protein [Oscillospiraceae bacterium]|nr:pilus assembly protein [Oscillospiraceae bacterium]